MADGWREFPVTHMRRRTPPWNTALEVAADGGGRALEAPLKLAIHQRRPGPSMTEGFLVILIKASCSTPSSI